MKNGVAKSLDEKSGTSQASVSNSKSNESSTKKLEKSKDKK